MNGLNWTRSPGPPKDCDVQWHSVAPGGVEVRIRKLKFKPHDVTEHAAQYRAQYMHRSAWSAVKGPFRTFDRAAVAVEAAAAKYVSRELRWTSRSGQTARTYFAADYQATYEIRDPHETTREPALTVEPKDQTDIETRARIVLRAATVEDLIAVANAIHAVKIHGETVP